MNKTKQKGPVVINGIKPNRFLTMCQSVAHYIDSVNELEDDEEFVQNATVIMFGHGKIADSLRTLARRVQDLHLDEEPDVKANQDGTCAEETGEDPSPSPEPEEGDSNEM